MNDLIGIILILQDLVRPLPRFFADTGRLIKDLFQAG